MNLNELRILQNYPLELKVEKTKLRIKEWYEHYNGEVYVSFSGGKDSTVLLDIVRSMYPDIEAVFINTGLEYPEIYKFVKTFKSVTILKPEMNFKQVINTYGYPVISKENSQYIYEIRHSTKKMRQRRLYGDSKGRFKLPNKYHYLIDAPFEISNKCCEVMKKRPVKKFEKETGKVPIIGTMAEESSLRQQSYLQHGCNAFESKRPVSTPLGFWKQQDVLEYIYKNDLKIASVYGEVIEDKNLLDECTYSTTGCERTGCIYCLYGIQCDTTPNRIQRLKKTHTKQYNYCINKLKLGEVLDYIGVKY
ncbi:phosphoadenosine phosphosulfate reductase family protein [Terrisporobacter sp.]|uniref:phosphoadenosine phosphosulfate reductase family protein n=1 Tax=Terrisporobacter sp. TaxID=1965305 RepID=UPI00399ACEE5